MTLYYLLDHPEKGFLAGYSKRKFWTWDFLKARKFNRQSDASNCRNTSYNRDLKDCKIIKVTSNSITHQLID
jgi:hypothetical protein